MGECVCVLRQSDETNVDKGPFYSFHYLYMFLLIRLLLQKAKATMAKGREVREGKERERK